MTDRDFSLRPLDDDDIDDVAKCLVDWGTGIGRKDLMCLLDLGQLLGGIGSTDGIQAIVSTLEYGDTGWICHAGSSGAHRELATLLIDHACGTFDGDIVRIGIDIDPSFARRLVALGFHETTGIMTMRADRFTVPDGPDETPAVVRPLQDADFDDIVFYDEDLFGGERGDALLFMLGGAVEAAHVATVGQWVAGYLLARPSHGGYRIGPLLAEDEDIAKSLLRQALDALDGPVELDLIAQHVSLAEWLRALGFKDVGTKMRLFKGAPDRSQDLSRCFLTGGAAFG